MSNTPPSVDTRGVLRWTVSALAIAGVVFLAARGVLTGAEATPAIMGILGLNFYPKPPPPEPPAP